METYNEQINEFIDWVSGQNTFTGQDATGEKPVSGKRIRELLQNRLKTPFVLKEDIQNGKYRMFSSEYAYQLWLENPSDNAGLEIFNFVRPSEYKLVFTGLNNANKYIRYGDSESLDARIQYSWSISNDDGLSSESLQVTYTISNESTGKVNTFTRWYNAGESVDFSIYQYLKPGRNSIVISGLGVQNGAKNSANFNIVMLELNVESSFQFYKKYTNGTQVRIPCTFSRNDDSGTARIHYIIDAGETSQQEWTTDIIASSGTITNAEKSIILDLESGQHTLQIYAECSYNEGSVHINTNLLYYTFVVATNDISTQKYICIGTSFNTGIFPMTSLTLNAMQYMQSKLEWGYYTEALSSDSKITIAWKLYENEEDSNPTTLSTITANTQTKSPDLQFIPTIYSEYDQSSRPLTYISAQHNNVELLRIPIQIVRNGDFSVYEITPYSLKLSAYGKTNDSSDKDNWGEATFTGIQWNQNSGWYQNSLRTCGQNEYISIPFKPFEDFDINQSGKTIEIEFETEKITNDDDVLIRFGTNNRGRIEITPTKATLYTNSNEEIVHTNYKSNERLKLTFIINDVPANQSSRTQQSGLAYIVNNGILERAASAARGQYNNTGEIKIGGSDSGVRVYSIRVYNYALTYTQAYNNFLYDSEDKAILYERNNIIGLGDKISYDLCKNKIDTILISGNLTTLLDQNTLKDESVTEVTIQRTCPSDSSKNFKMNNVRIRKHGQSTLNYPVPSMKIWMNKSNTENVVPTYEITPQEPLQLGKNRYRMKSNSIPTNKFILQANYADSSGVHNGGLQRLINETWYNAVIDGKYLLRTEPQLFTSISPEDKEQYGLEHVWGDYVLNSQFPYKLQIAPDSFPCAVFYQNTGDETQTFLGQYVFMEDKKSDFLYGERSIYKVPSDPFCLTTTHADDDTKENRVWNNKDVLRIEVLESNNVYSSYMTNNEFTDIENIVDSNTQEIIGRRYKWERAFEMVFPDPDDLEEKDAKGGIDKFNQNSQFVTKAQPFVDWYNWVVSTRNNQQKFQEEAAQHLDLYKMAAYYIFVLRFGLVDSMERNAQIKTYDGIHFHYEPWDMDIALGNKNDGGIAYDPPIDRNTKLSTSTYAISGRSADDNGNIVTTNWLWDALENWSEWANVIVPKVANALFAAGLTYNNICQMFDENYADAWSETIYNKSGDFKYIESRGTDDEWLRWLQGARITHRHWWLSTSMDYYDAKWFCGEYKQHSIYITANVSVGNTQVEEGEEGISGNSSSGKTIVITPNKGTYMVVQKDYITIDTQHVTPNEPLECVVPVMNTKNPFHVYGANFMESVDFSEIATGLDAVDFTGVYSEVLGSPLKNINIGCKITANNSDYNITLASLGGAIRGQATSFQNLQNLNIRGQQNFRTTYGFIYGNNITSLQNIYAMGSGLTDFYSSEQGNTFGTLELPSTVGIIQMNDSTWNNLAFWDTNIISGSQATLSLHSTNLGDNQYSNVPASINTIILNGTSCQSVNSITLIKNWLKSIVASNEDLQNYTFKADKINWGLTTLGNNSNLLTYNELSMLAQMGTIDIKGYILLQNENDQELTSQQLTQIKSWFGNSVFDRNSSGLVVDHQKNYIQINVGTAEGVTLENNEIYIKEGTRVSLNATRFSLAEEQSNDYVWGVEAVVAGTQHMCSIIDGQYTQDHITYLNVQESKIGGNYDIRVIVAIGANQYNTIIHVIGVTYPVNAYLTCDSKTNNIVRETPSFLEFYDSGMSADIYIHSDEQYTATVTRIEYTISRDDNVVQYNKQTGGNNFSSWIQTLELGVGQKGVLCTWPGALPSDGFEEYYTIKATITFASNRQIIVTKQLVVMQDLSPIINSINTFVYGVLANSWNTEYGTQLPTSVYKVHLLSLHGELNFSGEINNVVMGSSLATLNNKTLLKYVPNITSLIFDGCTQLTITSQYVSEDNGNQLIFDYILGLQKLSIKNCSALDGTIDLSNNTSIKQIYATGTTVSFTLPANTQLTNYELGTPTSIILDNPTVLIPDNISVNTSTNINTVELISVNKTSVCGFNTFAKIMGIS